RRADDLVLRPRRRAGAVAVRAALRQQARQRAALVQAAQALAQALVDVEPTLVRRGPDDAAADRRPRSGALVVIVGPGQDLVGAQGQLAPRPLPLAAALVPGRHGGHLRSSPS